MGMLNMMNRKNNQGFGLTEILIALVISLILMAGVLKIMSASKRTYALQSQLAGLQNNARFIMDELMRDIRMAGFKGCADQDPVGFNLPAAIAGDNDVAIEGVSEQFPASDSLTLSYLSAPLQWDRQVWDIPGSPELEDYGPPQLEVNQKIKLHADNPLLPNPGGQVIISDCGSSYLYTITDRDFENARPWIKVTPVSQSKPTFFRPVHIYPATFTANQYQVQAISQGQEHGFALFRNGQLLVEGVENMQFLYGIRSGQGLRYSEQPPTQGNIVSVRITLLMRTLERRYDLKEATRSSFELSPSITYSPQDNPAETGYRHRLFTSIIRIRNAEFGT